jgi:hypothetical protein
MQSSLDPLDAEARNFFTTSSEKEREETRAFQSALLRFLARDGETVRENHGT